MLDDEVEVGVVIGRAITWPIQVQADHLEEVVADLVMANDVSACDVHISEEQQRSCLRTRDGYEVFVQA